MGGKMAQGYRRSQIVLHWVTLGLVLWQFIGHDAISEAWRSLRQGTELAFNPLVAAHVLGGGAILALVLWRLLLRRRHGGPVEANPRLRLAAAVTHGGLYLLLIALTLSGAAAWFGGVEAAAEAHEVLKALLMALIGLHVAAALWHRFWLRDGVMARMLRAR